jgi:hypothetical protein
MRNILVSTLQQGRPDLGFEAQQRRCPLRRYWSRISVLSAYQKAIALDPEYALAMFDLGGTYWNSGDFKQASRVWTAAIARFPDHELAAKVKRKLLIFLAMAGVSVTVCSRSFHPIRCDFVAAL